MNTPDNTKHNDSKRGKSAKAQTVTRKQQRALKQMRRKAGLTLGTTR